MEQYNPINKTARSLYLQKKKKKVLAPINSFCNNSNFKDIKDITIT